MTDDAPAGHGALHDRTLGPETRRAAGAQPSLPCVVARPAGWLPGPHRDPIRVHGRASRRRSSAAGGRRADLGSATPGVSALRDRYGPRCTSTRAPATIFASSTSTSRRSTTHASGGRSTTPWIAAASRGAPGIAPRPTADLPAAPAGIPRLHARVPFHGQPEPGRQLDRTRTWAGPPPVAASGTRGMKVEFWGVHGLRGTGRALLPLRAAQARLPRARAHVVRLSRSGRPRPANRGRGPSSASGAGTRSPRALHVPAGAGLLLGRRELLADVPGRARQADAAGSPRERSRVDRSCGDASTPSSPPTRRPSRCSTGPRCPPPPTASATTRRTCSGARCSSNCGSRWSLLAGVPESHPLACGRQPAGEPERQQREHHDDAVIARVEPLDLGVAIVVGRPPGVGLGHAARRRPSARPRRP